MYDKNVIESLCKVIKDGNYQIVHANGIKPDLYALILKHKTKVKVIATCHNWIEKINFFEIFDKFILRFYDHIAATSHKVENILKKWGVNQNIISRISNGVSTDEVKEFSDVQKVDARGKIGINDEILFSFVGRLSNEKGIINLIKSFAKVYNTQTNVRLMVAGDGKLIEKCVDLTKKLGVFDKVFFVGNINDISLVYNVTDIFVLPSHDESCPYALLEAMAYGKAVIATNVGDVPEIVTDNVSGLIVKPNVQSISDSMSRSATDKTLIKTLGVNAKAVVSQRYSDIVMTENYLKIYQSMVKGNGNK